MTGARDHNLRDIDLEDEIELFGAVVAIAAHSSGHLTVEEVDEILGVEPTVS